MFWNHLTPALKISMPPGKGEECQNYISPNPYLQLCFPSKTVRPLPASQEVGHSLESISLWPSLPGKVTKLLLSTPPKLCLCISIWHQWTEAEFGGQHPALSLYPPDASCTLSLWPWERSPDNTSYPLGPKIAHLVRLQGNLQSCTLLAQRDFGKATWKYLSKDLATYILSYLAIIFIAFIQRKVSVHRQLQIGLPLALAIHFFKD